MKTISNNVQNYTLYIRKIQRNNFNEPLIIKLKLLAFVDKLVFGNKFNQNIDNLPLYLQYLTLGSNFNQSIDNLPEFLISLSIHYYTSYANYINHTVNNLPKNIKYLILLNNFNNSVDNLPNTLTYIHFGYYFNQPINYLPNSLVNLTLDSIYFNNCIDYLPHSIINLNICSNNLQSYDLKIINRITHSYNFSQLDENNILFIHNV